MRKAMIGVVAAAAVLLASGPLAVASERRPRVEQDDCSRKSAQCEQRCNAKAGMDRLNCKTDCRLGETQCRNSRR